MTVRTLIATLSAEDLVRYRESRVEQEGAAKAPGLYSKQDIEASLKRFMRMMGEFVTLFDIDDTQDWDVSSYTGIVYYYSGDSP